MNNLFADWSMVNNYGPTSSVFPAANQMKTGRTEPSEDELVELLWENGNIVIQSQTHRKMTSLNEKQHGRHDATKVIDENQTSTWLSYSLDDSLDNKLSSDFYESPTDPLSLQRGNDVIGEEDRFGEYDTFEVNSIDHIVDRSSGLSFKENVMSPKSHDVPSTQTRDYGNAVNFAHFTRPLRIEKRTGGNNFHDEKHGEVGEAPSPVMKETSMCGSNQVEGNIKREQFNALTVPSEKPMKNAPVGVSYDTVYDHMHETTVTSSSGLGYSFGRMEGKSVETKIHKRKSRDAEDCEHRSEVVKYDSGEDNIPNKRPASARRSRAAEVHNLAERRRRDKINEKMKALQELIPHCNKTDKASMLDEAIEYLKSLQLQLQMMWMGSSMATMMFPGMQYHMPHVGLRMGNCPITSVPSPVHLSRLPVISQSMPLNHNINQSYQAPLFPSTFVSQIIHDICTPKPRVQYTESKHGPPSSQTTGLHGSLLMHQNPATISASTIAACSVVAPSKHTQNVKTG